MDSSMPEITYRKIVIEKDCFRLFRISKKNKWIVSLSPVLIFSS